LKKYFPYEKEAKDIFWEHLQGRNMSRKVYSKYYNSLFRVTKVHIKNIDAESGYTREALRPIFDIFALFSNIMLGMRRTYPIRITMRHW